MRQTVAQASLAFCSVSFDICLDIGLQMERPRVSHATSSLTWGDSAFFSCSRGVGSELSALRFVPLAQDACRYRSKLRWCPTGACAISGHCPRLALVVPVANKACAAKCSAPNRGERGTLRDFSRTLDRRCNHDLASQVAALAVNNTSSFRFVACLLCRDTLLRPQCPRVGTSRSGQRRGVHCPEQSALGVPLCLL